jgi:hypothetical protein
VDLNNRQRILAVLNGKEPDHVPWFGDLSYWGLSLQKGLVGRDYSLTHEYYQLHRELGVGFYLQGYEPFTATYDDSIQVENENRGDLRIRRVLTPIGQIEEHWRWLPKSFCEAPVKHFIEDIEDLRVFRYWLEHTTFVANYDEAKRRYDLVGDMGVVLCYLPKSPLMQLIALYAGIESVVMLWMDYKAEFNVFMEVLRQKSDEAAEVALNSPAECLMIPENLSSEVVGKRFFHDYAEDYLRFWVQRIDEMGKYSFIHMDGTLKGLIAEVGDIGFSVMEALTPKPVGDLSLLEIEERVDKSIIWGGIPGIYFTSQIKEEEFDRLVIKTLEIMKRQPRFVLGVSDQVPPDGLEKRIRRVGELVVRFGRY